MTTRRLPSPSSEQNSEALNGIARCSEAGEPDYRTCDSRQESLDACAQREHALWTERLDYMCQQLSRRQRDEPFVGDAHVASSPAVEDKAERQIRVAHLPSENPDFRGDFVQSAGATPPDPADCCPRRGASAGAERSPAAQM